MTDMRVAQPRCVLRFAAQPGLSVATVDGCHLQRNLAAELGVARGIYVTHAAAAEQTLDFVVTDDGADQRCRCSRALDELRRLTLCVEQTFDFGEDRLIARARFGNECRARAWLLFQCCIENIFDARPLLWIHLISANNQDLPILHSRPTVAGEICITSAVSSIVR